MALSEPNRRSPRQFNDLSGREWIRFTRSWFVHNPPRRKRSEIQHPAKYPEGMAEEFIRFFTRQDEWVLDPFAGVGSTLIACAASGRRGLGIEISPEFAALAREAVEAREQLLVNGDARDASRIVSEHGPGRVQLILTSPPYWDMLGKSRGGVQSVHKKRRASGLKTVYSNNARDLGNITDYDAFLDALRDVFVGMKPALEVGRYLVIICQNVRTPEGVVQPLAWDLARRLSGPFQFKGERIWVQDNKPLGIWGYPTEFVTNVHHHYCLVFKHGGA
ncbi:MAG: hypothetical protein FJX76_10485 [Armatimonadetes bacterium]|nr:hypothetical protein [Armatimonadota bacterium]